MVNEAIQDQAVAKKVGNLYFEVKVFYICWMSTITNLTQYVWMQSTLHESSVVYQNRK
jgi:hypothetical protein